MTGLEGVALQIDLDRYRVRLLAQLKCPASLASHTHTPAVMRDA